MMAFILVLVLLAAVVSVAIVLALRRRFTIHLDRLDAEIRKSSAALSWRSDLPAAVVALGERMGARVESVPAFAVFEQTGQMWQMPGGKPRDFTAKQIVQVGTPGFLWRATMGPVIVADYFIAGTGGMEVMLLGAFPIARAVGGAAADQGEILRYLVELPWCPDAILANRSLVWVVIDAKTIKVAAGAGAARGEVTFELDDDGLIARASAPSRAYAEANGRTSARPWRGRFWDYQRIGGRLMPMQGEVAWGLETGDFVYWRGRILGWRGSRS